MMLFVPHINNGSKGYNNRNNKRASERNER